MVKLVKKSLKITKGVIRIHIPKKNRQHNGQKKKVQKDKQQSTKHTYKTKDRVTQTPLKTGGELRCSGRVSSSCSTIDTCCVTLVTNTVISHALNIISNSIHTPNLISNSIHTPNLISNNIHTSHPISILYTKPYKKMNHINGVMIRVLGLSEEDCGSNKLIFVASPLGTQHQGVKAKTR